MIGPKASIFDRLKEMPSKLGDIAHIFVGLQTSADSIYVLEGIEPPHSGLVRVKDQNGEILLLEREVLKPFLKKVTVSTFETPISHHWLIFPYRISNERSILIPPEEMSSSFPKTWEYLKDNKKALCSRESGKADNAEWYGYIYRKNLKSFDDPKLIVQVISLFGRYSYDDTGIYFTGGGNGPYYGIRRNDKNNRYSLYFLQALLSSPLLDFYLHEISSPFRGGYWSYGKRFIEMLPIRDIDFENSEDKVKHDNIVEMVAHMLSLHQKVTEAKSPQTKTVLQRQIEATDRQINKLVYQLYDLTDEEIEIVETARG